MNVRQFHRRWLERLWRQRQLTQKWLRITWSLNKIMKNKYISTSYQKERYLGTFVSHRNYSKLILENAKARARMVGDWPEIIRDVVFWQNMELWRAFFCVLDISSKLRDSARIWSGDMLHIPRFETLAKTTLRQRSTCLRGTSFLPLPLRIQGNTSVPLFLCKRVRK